MALSSELRSTLEKAIVSARDAAEEASRVALGVLAVDAERAPDAFDEGKRRLRVALRAEARQLGGYERLVEECAYEQWHRMLFARFLAENDLLIHPEHAVAVTLADCEEIAHSRGGTDLWIVASEFASQMLPGIFRSNDAVLELTLAPEGQQRLEEILARLASEVFTSEDGLGWVYQYWQAKKKKEVNASERKIGGADIAPVTQLFTENYMVRFLLENTLGAWWTSRHPESPLAREWEYLRFDDEGMPAAGSFPGWPETVAEVTVMDPCCGSGHFLVVAFEMLRKMRMEAEGLSAAETADAVLRDNLFGLELDARCTQIAAFALTLQAWKTGGYRELPIPNIACSGISAEGRLEDWKKVAGRNERLERSLERLHALFADASDLGSLIDPLRETDADLLVAEFAEVAPLLERALANEKRTDPTSAAFGHAVAGAARAAAFLGGRYALVVTNPPFLGRGKQANRLKKHCENSYPMSKSDLATCFIQRDLGLASAGGSIAMVTPQNWLFLATYTPLRRALLNDQTWDLIARLGSGAFETIGGEVVNAALLVASASKPSSRAVIAGVDVTAAKRAVDKAVLLRSESGAEIAITQQSDQLKNPDARIVFAPLGRHEGLSKYATVSEGLHTGDYPRFGRKYWELPAISNGWSFQQGGTDGEGVSGGCEHVLFWEEGKGELIDFVKARLGSEVVTMWIKGHDVWGKRGVAVGTMNELKHSLYHGDLFTHGIVAIVPHDEQHAAAVLAYVDAPEFRHNVRLLDQKISVARGAFENVPFDVAHWKRVAAEKYPGGLPESESDDPTQWLFHGRPEASAAPLQVGVARLVGYRSPPEIDEAILLSRRARELVGRCVELQGLVDEDAIVCLPSVRGERPAAERLRALLASAFSAEWSSAKEADLLAEVGYAGRSLEQWLCDGFFDQHCQLFHQRPFVWHIWDGRKDGFSALVNYHRLDRANLEKLIFTYLGDWIRQQRASAAAGTPGADTRLANAEELQKKLELILKGEDPYDIFVRWKPLEEHPLGWEPNLNDGVRLNIRPFVTAGVLRKNPKIKWGKDRGKDLDSAPWYPVFKGDRINDHHLALAEKRAAREAADRRAAAS